MENFCTFHGSILYQQLTYHTAPYLHKTCIRTCHQYAVSVKRIPTAVLYSLSFFLNVTELVELMFVISRQLLVVVVTLLLLLALFAGQIRQDIIQPSKHRNHHYNPALGDYCTYSVGQKTAPLFSLQ